MAGCVTFVRRICSHCHGSPKDQTHSAGKDKKHSDTPFKYSTAQRPDGISPQPISGTELHPVIFGIVSDMEGTPISSATITIIETTSPSLSSSLTRTNITATVLTGINGSYQTSACPSPNILSLPIVMVTGYLNKRLRLLIILITG